MSVQKVVAIDGPTGSGKSSIAKMVADKLDFLYIDTGAMYRGIGFALEKGGVSFDDIASVIKSLENMEISYGESEFVLIRVNGQDLTKEIREHRVSDLASRASKIKEVREYLLDKQRALGTGRFCVMEGRDIGTVVFPNSFFKVYLTASPEVRAERRYLQLKEKGDSDITVEKVLEDLKERDYRDMNRDIAPLKQADDAYLLDSSKMTFDQVVSKIVELTKEEMNKQGLGS